MDKRFWMGFLVGFLLGIILTALSIFLWFVPIRTTTSPASAPALDRHVVDVQGGVGSAWA